MDLIEKWLSEHLNKYISKGKQDTSILEKIYSELNFRPGEMLKKYLINNGFLSYGSVELLGVGIKDSSRLNAIKETKKLKNEFKLPNGYFAIENLGDGLCIVCDQIDKVFEFNYNEIPKDLNMYFDEYVLKRFKEA